MRRGTKTVAVLTAFVVVFAVQAFALGDSSGKEKPAKQEKVLPKGCAHAATFKRSRGFIRSVWAREGWDRSEDGLPRRTTLDAYARRLRCAAGPGHREAMRSLWRARKKIFFKHRGEMLFRARVTPFRCGDSWWATPCEIPLHESGYCTGGTNCYGMLDAWYLHGCTEFAPSGFGAPLRAQHVCARRHYLRYGRGGWPPY